jgi:PGF-pre-PGF domain-containing protein
VKNEGKLYSIVLTSTVLFFVFLFLISTVASAGQVPKTGNGSDPAIYGSKVVWTNGGVIHVYDLTAKTDITINSSAASYPAIYGNKLVWFDESSGTPRLAVYDMSIDAKTYITQNIDQSSRPAIYGNRIVWSADYNETNYNYNVYMRDISTSIQTRIAYGQDPDIYDTRITYTYDNGDGRRIALYDITTKEAIEIPYSGDLGNSHIYGNNVIWSDFYTRLGYIAMYDIATKKVTTVTSDNVYSGDSDNPDAGCDTGIHTDIYGDKIVYAKAGTDQFGSAGVYVYSISTGHSIQVANYENGVITTPSVYNNTIVWGIGGKYSGGVANDNGIYMSDFSATTTLSPVAKFTANVTSGVAPLVVRFNDLGTGGLPTSWLWDFGDGINSKNAMNATHTFTKPGIYNVTLTVTNEAGNSSIAKLGYIKVTNSTIADPAIANFNSNVTEGYAPLAVQFSDTSQNAISRVWDFNNDGKTDSSDPAPVYVYTAPGTYFVNLKITNANGNSSMITMITVLKSSSGDDSSSSSSGSSSSGSGGGGNGGAGGSPEPAKNVEVKELSQAFITNGKPVKFDFAKNATCVVYVSFDSKKTAGKSTTIAEQLKNKSILVSDLNAGEVYKYFNVWVGTGGFATSKNIENSAVCFKVEKSWVKDKKINPDSITLNRYSDKKWSQLPVKLLDEDDKYLYFTAETPGFSSFAITGKTKNASEETVAEKQLESDNGTINQNSTADKESQNEQKEIQGTPAFQTVCGVAGLLAAFLYKRKSNCGRPPYLKR